MKLKKWQWVALVCFIILVCIPIPDYSPSYSYAVYGVDGTLLSATVSDEQQWCLPLPQNLPEKLKRCIILYEDEYFNYHLGINPVSVFRAWQSNRQNGNTVRGASTLTMQVMRIKHHNARRTWKNKLLEACAAVKYSLTHTKSSTLKEWAQIAPFGGNTIGVQSASVRYFGRNLDQLSWAECATLAVLPNNPSYANLQKNRLALVQKRNRLLKKLLENGELSSSEYNLYIDEDLPLFDKEIPRKSYHFLQYLKSIEPKRFQYESTINPYVQESLHQLLQQEMQNHIANGIKNVACTIIDLKSNATVAYVGNTPLTSSTNLSYVDVVQRPRSYGSILKPVLYAYAIESGHILPKELLWDIPTNIADFTPQNFDKKYRGAVPAQDMVIQSLNVPAVRLLYEIGTKPFYDHLTSTHKLSYLDKGADHYGLTLILGGGETTLWDLAHLYKNMAQEYFGYSKRYQDVQVINKIPQNNDISKNIYSSFTLKHVIDAMSNVNRPREEEYFQRFSSAHTIAWKTGTSQGHRDAWSIGFNSRYLVAIWVGNENGEGKSNLTGIATAAPMMFDVFNMMGDQQWADPVIHLKKKSVVTTCTQSGKLSSPLCTTTEKLFVPWAPHSLKTCSHHEVYNLDNEGTWWPQHCPTPPAVHQDTAFILPAEVAYYFKSANAYYKGQPSVSPLCKDDAAVPSIIYPYQQLKVFLPQTTEKRVASMIAKAHHPSSSSLIWYIDDTYLGKTQANTEHELLLSAKVGKHTLIIIDQQGSQAKVAFEVLGD